jgi:hypothetical protein
LHDYCEQFTWLCNNRICFDATPLYSGSKVGQQAIQRHWENGPSRTRRSIGSQSGGRWTWKSAHNCWRDRLRLLIFPMRCGPPGLLFHNLPFATDLFSRLLGDISVTRSTQSRSQARNAQMIPISQHHEAQLRGLRHSFGPTVGIELGEYRSDMKFGGVERNTQAAGNRFV